MEYPADIKLFQSIFKNIQTVTKIHFILFLRIEFFFNYCKIFEGFSVFVFRSEKSKINVDVGFISVLVNSV